MRSQLLVPVIFGYQVDEVSALGDDQGVNSFKGSHCGLNAMRSLGTMTRSRSIRSRALTLRAIEGSDRGLYPKVVGCANSKPPNWPRRRAPCKRRRPSTSPSPTNDRPPSSVAGVSRSAGLTPDNVGYSLMTVSPTRSKRDWRTILSLERGEMVRDQFHRVPRHALCRLHDRRGGPPRTPKLRQRAGEPFTELLVRFESQLAKADWLNIDDVGQVALHTGLDARCNSNSYIPPTATAAL
ncbi:hypothetical protein E4U14_007942 [Claviceps sp. LM454 group G7]|nr:hypothetical protein E4U14_007942 [Claviceps sp. LM454 group G7]